MPESVQRCKSTMCRGAPCVLSFALTGAHKVLPYSPVTWQD
jgi:hypothetical protein